MQIFSRSQNVKDFKTALCQKSEIGLEIERSDTSSDRVYHACARKIGKAFWTSYFHPLDPAESETSRDQSPQTRKGHKTSDDKRMGGSMINISDDAMF